MLLLSVPIKLFLSLLIGAAIGLERESYDQLHCQNNKQPHDRKGSLGVRTFALITTLGTLSGLLRPDFPDLFITVNIVFLVLLVAYYVTGSLYLKDNGITTEMAIIFSYLIGIFIALDIFPIQLILAITVVLILILSQKDIVRQWITGINQSEVTAFISYSIIALVILPFLPNQNYSLSNIPGLSLIVDNLNLGLSSIVQIEIFNPYRLWFLVALITGVEVFGYSLSKVFGQKKGWLLTSFVAGFVSSTSTTISLAQKSQQSRLVNRLVASAILANLASFFQLFILIVSTNAVLLLKSFKVIVLIILSSLGAVFWYLRQKDSQNKELNTKTGWHQASIFSLQAALKFALIYLIISASAKISLVVFGEIGFYLTASIAALTGIDAVVLTLSSLAGTTLSYQAGVLTIVLVNAVNLLGKSIYVFVVGKREFAFKFLAAILLIIIFSLFGILA
ncbi:hypothetical protein A2313_01185 [Candidatus Roizmanbacteria bacterium RIFOXYB2_FULL_41_10]|uniref:Uncharacterized protein n=1 Tax=Candidatus Roizmanbacteria bacterium RIFOXYA1_FULL_41_12 TaxID=1802082 RepID=A0A1F7KF24_9BACT|nr:MAG: hypothetical protein A2209_01690 [Candidatus Roizmanbacteria bacterium RIFOXYA1_FULL_41_12]OGK67355.1 MAG: hypothetical protein A2262_02465 [Candidatus Roizmanbacteria bacterium RIFOXYA2_FULL_41_8]OGK67794.1 MAG: hypothetical protein A2377_04095 [Candidatus Roizmanbacteria bacterium RIFOXYB1_FULL_41_27]OGK69420.1 MAG: hypothetical protein A2313_01185 [Candidatus Roizmanbacteria bacterium RIFOXYB2_FULL_41_10]OGK71949.1 MAG: hypothetical protein A2403_03270 [Candidatus Roizmanbacteria bac